MIILNFEEIRNLSFILTFLRVTHIQLMDTYRQLDYSLIQIIIAQQHRTVLQFSAMNFKHNRLIQLIRCHFKVSALRQMWRTAKYQIQRFYWITNNIIRTTQHISSTVISWTINQWLFPQPWQHRLRETKCLAILEWAAFRRTHSIVMDIQAWTNMAEVQPAHLWTHKQSQIHHRVKLCKCIHLWRNLLVTNNHHDQIHLTQCTSNSHRVTITTTTIIWVQDHRHILH